MESREVEQSKDSYRQLKQIDRFKKRIENRKSLQTAGQDPRKPGPKIISPNERLRRFKKLRQVISEKENLLKEM